jgi:hypothetical protein
LISGTSSYAGAAAGYKISDSIGSDSKRSDIWEVQTKRGKYTAPGGHEIYKDPYCEGTGDGGVRIFDRKEHSFDYEITARKGTYSVNFSSYERWNHKVTSGEFKYRQPMHDYIKDLRETIANRIKDDHAGTFDVITELKKWRGC